MNVEMSIINLKGIGEKTCLVFEKLGIRTIRDLLNYFPYNYEIYTDPILIQNSLIGEYNAICAKVTGNLKLVKSKNLIIGKCFVSDTFDSMELIFFNMPFLKNVLKQGEQYIFRGVVTRKNNHLIMEQPKIMQYEDYMVKKNQLQPVYRLTKGLSNQTIRKAVKQALETIDKIEDYLPMEYRHQYSLSKHFEALVGIHYPENMEELIEARKRLVFDEFLLFILGVRRLKEVNERQISHFQIIEVAQTKRFLESLPYELTKAQMRVFYEIQDDLVANKVMNRLIQGDVGSGKTIVAILSLLTCVANGYQGAMMAPTEVLAIQHYDTLCKFTKKYHLPFVPVLLTGSMSVAQKKEAYEKLRNGEGNIAIGTHALIQKKVEFKNLALVVTDEQHRFGVTQRELLAGKGDNVHILIMSATPIPRTLAIILYGDLQISVIDELPANRLPIKNCVVGIGYRKKAYQFMEEEIKKGHQVYIICPMIEEGEMNDLENVMDYSAKLINEMPETIRIGLLHGKMSPKQKNSVMEQFSAHNIDILIATTVIEVGIDVPNATVIMIENAERFGLAQLHQLRGRIGRGPSQSYCIFMTSHEKEDTIKRLQILNHSNDGFEIAGEDLKLRGPGDIFGIRQSGNLEFVLADIYTDANVMKQASECADDILIRDKELQTDEFLQLRKYLDFHNRNQIDFPTI